MRFQVEVTGGGVFQVFLDHGGADGDSLGSQPGQEPAGAGLGAAGGKVVGDQPESARGAVAWGGGQGAAVEPVVTRGHGLAIPAGSGQGNAVGGLGDRQAGDHPGEVGGGGVRGEQVDVRMIPGEFFRATDGGGDDGEAGGQGFELREAESLVGAGGDQHVGRGEDIGNLAD